MEKNLALICQNRWNIGCHQEVIDAYLPPQDKVNLWPKGEKLKKINDICRQCVNRFFIVGEDACPVCGSADLAKQPGSREGKCNGCDSKLQFKE